MIKENRIGRVLLSKDVIESEEIHLVLSSMKFIPVRVEFLYMENSFEYIGYSAMFEKIHECSVTPTYTISVEKDEDEIVNIYVKRESND